MAPPYIVPVRELPHKGPPTVRHPAAGVVLLKQQQPQNPLFPVMTTRGAGGWWISPVKGPYVSVRGPLSVSPKPTQLCRGRVEAGRAFFSEPEQLCSHRAVFGTLRKEEGPLFLFGFPPSINVSSLPSSWAT